MSSGKGRKRRGKRYRVSRENRAAMFLITFVVCLLFVVLLLEGHHLNERIDANELHRQQLQDEIAGEEARTESIAALREYMHSDEYIRQAAKDRLGLVESDEVVFKEAE